MAKKKRKINASTIARLRELRRKHGLGEFKRNSSIKKTSKTKRVVRMAKRRRSFAPYRFSRRSRVRRAVKSKGASELALIGYAVVGENLFDQVTRNFNMGISPRIIKLGAGYMLKKKSGLVGQLGTAMYTVELYKLGKDIASGGLNLGNLLGGTSSQSTSTVSSGATFA